MKRRFFFVTVLLLLCCVPLRAEIDVQDVTDPCEGILNPDDCMWIGTSTSNGGSQICRATWGQPETYCFIETWTCDDNGKCVSGCARGVTTAGWCSCVNKVLKGSCLFR